MTHPAAIRHRPLFDRPIRQVLEAIEADPLAPRHVCLVAPGGYGKSVIVGELSELYRRAGVDVVGLPQALTELDDHADGTAVVVDDAHQLAEPQLRALLARAAATPLRLVLAYRPWPRSAALAELIEVPGRPASVLAPAPFDPGQVALFLTRRWEVAPAAELVQFVHAQTGGVPRFVERVSSGLDGCDARDPTDPRDPALTLPRSAILRFRFDLDRLDADVQRLLLAVEAGAGLHIELLSELFGRDADAIAELMAAARATGLLGHDGALLPISRRAIGSLIPLERRAGVRQRLAELQLDRGGSVLALARSLLGTGVVGASMAGVFRAAAGEALAGEPELAAKLYAAAVTAGGPLAPVAAGWAEAAARSGDLDTALRLADQVLAGESTVDRARAAGVAAAALAHRGQLGRSAELYRWAGGDSSLAFAAVGLIGTGKRAQAEELPDVSPTGNPPTLLDGAAALLAQGVAESVAGSATDALPTLVRAATLLEPTGRAALLPDSPAAVAALVALHCGEFGIAESVLARAAATEMGGAALSARHRLLLAWISMVRGHFVPAVEQLAAVGRGRRRLEPRDMLFAVALEAALARRASDLPGMRRAWEHAREAVMRHPVDLFSLLPLGELAVAAARLRDHGRLAPHLAAAESMLDSLGNPPLWAIPLRWTGVHAAIIAEQPAMAEQQAAALAALAGREGRHDRYRTALSDAAECWLKVVGGEIDPSTVESAARGLHGVGLCWDGARLAGQAAIRTSDRQAMVHLLDCARQLQGRPTRAAKPAATPTAEPTAEPAAGPVLAPASRLSDREQEVADLVLGGLTYKQIGDRLFISAKTVEHHVARIRQKLGCASRSELLAQLRCLLRSG